MIRTMKRLQPTHTPTSPASGHMPAPNNNTATDRAARAVDGNQKYAHDCAHLFEKRMIFSRIMGRSGVDRSHLACHEQTAGGVQRVHGVCERVERAGGWLCDGRGLS